MRMKGWSGSLGWLVELTLYELFYMYEYQSRCSIFIECLSIGKWKWMHALEFERRRIKGKL